MNYLQLPSTSIVFQTKDVLLYNEKVFILAIHWLIEKFFRYKYFYMLCDNFWVGDFVQNEFIVIEITNYGTKMTESSRTVLNPWFYFSTRQDMVFFR